PERLAILYEDQAISYAQLRADVTRFANALATTGLQAGERVALFLGNSPAFVVAYLGTHLAGGIVVLVNTQYRQVELSHILNDAAVRVCVTSSAGQETLRPLNIPTLEHIIIADNMPQPGQSIEASPMLPATSFADFLARGSERADIVLPLAEAPALIGYTSGTTGRSKGALLLHRNLLANIQAVTSAWHWTNAD